MSLKEKIKRFWTLDVHNHKGFTLVELIIVIAILAILSSVAVVGYSSYIKKANIQADKTLIAEIENALMLAYYSGEITESGYVVLTMDKDANPSDDDVKDVLLASFGNLRGLKLKHNGWTEGGNFGAYASSVNGSFVTNGTDDLLKDVEGCAGKLAEFMVGSDLFKGEEGAALLDGLLQSNGAVSGMLSGYEDGEIDETVLANATVFGLAASLKNSTNAEAVVNGFAEGTYMEISPSGEDILVQTAHKYAALEAFVHYVNCECAQKALDKFNTEGMGGANANAIVAALDNACFEALSAVETCANGCASKIADYYGLDENGEPDPNVAKSPAQQDGEAYVATMVAVDSLSGDYTTSLGNASLFTDGTVSNDLNTYLNLAAAIPTEGAYYVVSFRIDEAGINFD